MVLVPTLMKAHSIGETWTVGDAMNRKLEVFILGTCGLRGAHAGMVTEMISSKEYRN